jgi:hypothetical protein
MTHPQQSPERWLESEGEWRDVAFELKREAGAPEPAARARMLAALTTKVATPATSLPGPSHLPASQPGTSSAMVVKGGALVALALLGLLGAYLALRVEPVAPVVKPSEQASEVVHVPTVEVQTPVAPPQPTPQAETLRPVVRKPERPRRMPAPAPTPLEPSASSAMDPAAELALLVRARRVLQANPARTLELTEEHARNYERGAFAEEREVLAIEALIRTQEREGARERFERFALAFPNSTHLARIRALLK